MPSLHTRTGQAKSKNNLAALASKSSGPIMDSATPGITFASVVQGLMQGTAMLGVDASLQNKAWDARRRMHGVVFRS